MASFDRAVSSGSLAFAADAVCYGNSIVLLLFDRFTTAWERYRSRSSRSQCPHYAPGMKVPRIRKRLIVGTRSVRRARGLLETGLSVKCPPRRSICATYRKSRCTSGRFPVEGVDILGPGIFE